MNHELIGNSVVKKTLIKPLHTLDVIPRTGMQCKLIEHINSKIGEIYAKTIITRDIFKMQIDEQMCIDAFGEKITIKQILKRLGFEMKCESKRQWSVKSELPGQRDFRNREKLLEFVKKYDGPINENIGKQRQWGIKKLKTLKKLHKLTTKNIKLGKEIGNFKLNLSNIFNNITLKTIQSKFGAFLPEYKPKNPDPSFT